LSRGKTGTDRRDVRILMADFAGPISNRWI
jgi:hypothetical protein